MKAPIITNEKVETEITTEVMTFSLKLGVILCGLIGFWAASCLLAGLTRFGALEMLRGYITAITGV